MMRAILQFRKDHGIEDPLHALMDTSKVPLQGAGVMWRKLKQVEIRWDIFEAWRSGTREFAEFKAYASFDYDGWRPPPTNILKFGAANPGLLRVV